MPDNGISPTEQNMPFEEMFVFAREDNIWKAKAFWDFTDWAEIDRDWDYMSTQWQKDFIGDLPNYAKRYSGCSISN